MPRISVLMPVYNTKEIYLREAIESILNQTFENFELLILDDGSTQQDTINTIALYKDKDKRIRIIKGEHKGIGAARNRLIKESCCDICAFMDSDDIALVNRLEDQFNFLHSNIDIDICGSWYKIIPSNTVIKRKERPTFFDFIEEMSVANPTLMFRKNIFFKYNLKFNENLSTSEDYEFCSRAIRYVSIYNLQKVLLHYRFLSDSNCHSNPKELQKNDYCIREKMLKFLTHDKNMQNKIIKLLNLNQNKIKNTIQNIFSLKNEYKNDIKHKIITILGIKIKFKRGKHEQCV